MKLMVRMVVFAGLVASGIAQAQPLFSPSLTVLDDFESYTSTNALSAAWSNSIGAPIIGLETNIICGGAQALRMKYSLSAVPHTNTVSRNFGSPQDWSSFNTITFNYGGTISNSTDNVIVQLLDHLGGILGSFSLTNATAYTPCTNVALDLSRRSLFTNVTHHTDLHDVQSFVLGVAGGANKTSGTIYFDNLVVGNNGNFITNPGFQDLNNNGIFGDGWNSSGVQQFLNFLPENTPGHATFFTDTNGNTGSVSWPAQPAAPGTKFRLTIDADCESSWRADTRFGLEFLDADLTTVLTQRIVGMFAYSNTPYAYKTYSMTAVVPPDVAAIRPVISYTNTIRLSSTANRGVLDNACLAVETNKVLSIFAASIHKGLYASGYDTKYTLNGSYAHSFGAWLTTLLTTNGWRVDNRSVPGDSTTNLHDRFYHDEMPVGADVVFIGTSMGNSGLHGSTNPGGVYTNFFIGYSNLVAMSRSNGLLPMLGGGFPRDLYTTNEFSWIKKMDLLINTFDVPSANFVGAVDDGIGHIVFPMGSGDGIHYSDAGHYELFLCFVPSLFDALMAGKPMPRWSANHRFARITGDALQPSPLTFTPSSTVHSFSMSFRVRASDIGTIASVSLPGATNQPTIELRTNGVAYISSSNQVLTSSVPVLNGAWHEIFLTHQFSRTQTWLYVDSILAGSVRERLTPVAFVLGGPGDSVSRPSAPTSADYENWFIHRSALLIEEVQAQFQGALQQASLELYAPLDDATLVTGGPVTNCAQSLAVINVKGSNVTSQPVPPIIYLPSGKVMLNLYGIPTYSYDVQRSLLSDFSTVTVLKTISNIPVNGLVSFSDTNPPSASAFYRLKQR